jgi:hypothetical protein
MLTGRVTLIVGRIKGGRVMLTACECIGAALVVVALRSVATAMATTYLCQRVNTSSFASR